MRINFFYGNIQPDCNEMNLTINHGIRSLMHRDSPSQPSPCSDGGKYVLRYLDSHSRNGLFYIICSILYYGVITRVRNL